MNKKNLLKSVCLLDLLPLPTIAFGPTIPPATKDSSVLFGTASPIFIAICIAVAVIFIASILLIRKSIKLNKTAISNNTEDNESNDTNSRDQ